MSSCLRALLARLTAAVRTHGLRTDRRHRHREVGVFADHGPERAFLGGAHPIR